MISLLGLVWLAVDRTILVIKAKLDFELFAKHSTCCNSTFAKFGSKGMEVLDIVLDL